MYITQFDICKTADEVKNVMESSNAALAIVLTPELVLELCKYRYNLAMIVDQADIMKVSEISSNSSGTSYESLRIYLPPDEFKKYWQNDSMRSKGVVLTRQDGFDQRTIAFRFLQEKIVAPRSQDGGESSRGSYRGRGGRGAGRPRSARGPRPDKSDATMTVESMVDSGELVELDLLEQVIEEVAPGAEKMKWADQA